MEFNPIDYINSFLRFGSKLGLERIEHLLAALGHPEQGLRIIHVAGTNGKGSICAYAAAMLSAAGYRCGLFTSPYVVDFRERFQVDGVQISERELCEITLQLREVVNALPEELIPTEFELITAIGYIFFARRRCDAVLLEVGLGGRYDSTNTITPRCSVIGSIGLDHTAVLGDTIEEIAFQKAGIIKPSVPCVCYPLQREGARRVIGEVAAAQRVRVVTPQLASFRLLQQGVCGSEFEYEGMRLRVAMAGENQPYNAITAIEAVRQAGFSVSEQQTAAALARVRVPARCEIIEPSRPIIVDGAHNPDGVAALAALLQGLEGRAAAVIGMMADKDFDSVLMRLAPLFARIYTVTVDNPRSLSAKQLCAAAARYNPRVEAADSLAAAIDAALCDPPDGAVVVCGSFYMAGEARRLLSQRLSPRDLEKERQ